jgi:hypothetical protein
MVLRKFSGEVISRADVPYLPAPAVWDEVVFPLLSGVDLNGDTAFNARQMRRLLAEVERLAAQDDLSAEVRSSLDAVAALCQEGQRPPHRFLWFIGD